MTGQDRVVFLIKILFALLAVASIGFYLILPLIRSIRTRPEVPDLQLPDSTTIPEDEVELQIPEDGEKPSREAIVEQALVDPRRTARLVANWIREKK